MGQAFLNITEPWTVRLWGDLELLQRIPCSKRCPTRLLRQSMCASKDPYFYINRLARLPKFVIQTGNDDFFIPDNTIEWWAAVPEPKWQLGCPYT